MYIYVYIYIHIIHNHYSSVEIPFDGINSNILADQITAELFSFTRFAYGGFLFSNAKFIIWGIYGAISPFFLRHLKQIQVRSFALQHPWHHRVVSAATHAPYRGECCQDARWGRLGRWESRPVHLIYFSRSKTL